MAGPSHPVPAWLWGSTGDPKELQLLVLPPTWLGPLPRPHDLFTLRLVLKAVGFSSVKRGGFTGASLPSHQSLTHSTFLQFPRRGPDVWKGVVYQVKGVDEDCILFLLNQRCS